MISIVQAHAQRSQMVLCHYEISFKNAIEHFRRSEQRAHKIDFEPAINEAVGLASLQAHRSDLIAYPPFGWHS